MALLAISLVACTTNKPEPGPKPFTLSGTWLVMQASAPSLCYGVRIRGDAEPRSDALFYWAPTRSGCERRSSGVVRVAAGRRVEAGQEALTARIGLIAGGFSDVQLEVASRRGNVATGVLTVDGKRSSIQLVRVARVDVPLGAPAA
jgi:hypothetical protein